MTKPTLIAAAFAGVALVTLPALAMEPSLPRSPKIFAKLDADANGKITFEELQPKAIKRFTRFDGDNNGEVTSAEIDASLQKYMTLRRNHMLKAMDADANGAVSKAELDQFLKSLMKAADADADGGITLEEARTFRVAKIRKTLNGVGTN